MSLPLTRRIARAALLVAAGAAPVVGAAGTASALPQGLAPAEALSGVTAVDPASAGGVVDTASQTATGVVGEAGGKATGDTLGKTAGTATETAQAPVAGPLGEAVPNTGAVPGAGLIGGLPIGG
ncbi:ATP-binding protein [Streptomyces sp. NPDC004787]|uniref:ATP-binding protein n=1 Tax=Streptomyces sp. NPDC004787 TaxID=3154291 RepID=UPI0033B5D8DA